MSQIKFRRGNIVVSKIDGVIVIVNSDYYGAGSFSGTVVGNSGSGGKWAIGSYCENWAGRLFIKKNFKLEVVEVKRKDGYYKAKFNAVREPEVVRYDHANDRFYTTRTEADYTEEDFEWISDDPIEF